VSVRDCEHAAFANTTFQANVGGALFVKSSAVGVRTSTFIANVGAALAGSDLSALLVRTRFRDANGESIHVSRERSVEMRACEFAGSFLNEILSSMEAVKFDCRELVNFGPHLLGKRHPPQNKDPNKLKAQSNQPAGKPNRRAVKPNDAHSKPKDGPGKPKDTQAKPNNATEKTKSVPEKLKNAPGKQKGVGDSAGKRRKGGKEPPQIKPHHAGQKAKAPSNSTVLPPRTAAPVVITKQTIRPTLRTPIVEVVEKTEVLNVLVATYVIVIFVLVVIFKLFFQQMPGAQAKQILDNELLVEPDTEHDKEETGFKETADNE
jgi:hypothetical protein